MNRPSGLALIPIYVATAIFVALAIYLCAFSEIPPESVFSCIIYALAAITLGYSVYSLVIIIPTVKRSIVGIIKKREFTARLYDQYGFRTIVFSVSSFAFSVGNATFNGVIGFKYLSVWYISLAVYYVLLASMRAVVLVYHRKKKRCESRESDENVRKREIKTYRICGMLLIILPLSLSFTIFEMVVSERAFVKAGLMIYVAAAYTFYKTVTSIINFVKARKSDLITVRAIRNVNLAEAFVSVLALQTAMFHEFSPNENFGFANAALGATVCALTAAIGIIMIVKSNGLMKNNVITGDETCER